MKLLPEFPGVGGSRQDLTGDGRSWQELIGDDREGSGQEISGMVLELLGSNKDKHEAKDMR